MKDLTEIGIIEGDSFHLSQCLSKHIISAGEWRGTGILGEVVEAIFELEKAALEYGFSDREKDYDALKNARFKLFWILKRIEQFRTE